MKKFVLFLFVTSLFAGPPMKSSDPFVPALHEFEVNIATEGEHKELTLHRIPIIDINYGIVQNVQVTFETAYVNSEVENDFDSFEIALKWHFYESELFSIALYPKYKSYPVESIFNEGETYELSLPMNFRLNDSLDLVTDINYVYLKDSEEHFEFGTYIKYKDDKFSYFVEVFMEEAEHQKDFFTMGIVGFMYQFHENVAFMISYGKEITKGNPRATVGYSGFQFVF